LEPTDLPANTIPVAAIKRLAAVKGKGYRVGEDAVTLIDAATVEWIKKLAEESYVFAIHAERRTLKAVDVIPVLEKMGMKIPKIEVPPKQKAAKKIADAKKAEAKKTN
jgi:histone H3/H4